MHDNVHPEIKTIYDKAMVDLEALPQTIYGAEWAMHYSFAHLVWEDDNYDSDSIKWAIESFDVEHSPLTIDQNLIVLRSLCELLQLPDEILNSDEDA